MNEELLGRATGPPEPDSLPRIGLADHYHLPSTLTRVKVLVVVEGQYDIRFLQRVSRMLHLDDPRLPDLGILEQTGELIFVPIAGGNILSWTNRLAGLGIPEFHLYDREAPPETATRERAAELVNRRSGCRAVLTGKRHLENYLHPAAILEANGIELRFGDFEDVPELAAQAWYAQRHEAIAWSALPSRTRKRLRDRAKRWLNTYAVDCMTPERLSERDPTSEIRNWLVTIGALAEQEW